MKKTSLPYIVAALGLILVAVGLYLAKEIPNPQGIMKTLPYVLIGVGCGAFGSGTGTAISKRALQNSPELQKKDEINRKDERNIAIANRAKAKAYDVMVFVFGALLLCFALMGVGLPAVLLLIFAYLFVIGSALYFSFKYEKEM